MPSDVTYPNYEEFQEDIREYARAKIERARTERAKPMRKRTGYPPPEKEGEIVALGSDAHLLHIARKVDVSYYHAKKCLQRAGVPMRSRSEINTLRRPQVDPTELRQILDEAKMRHREIAAHFGVSVPTLSRVMRALGYKSVKGRGSPMEKNYFWRGGRTLDADGYVLLRAPDHPYAENRGYVREHRLVMEKKLGRYLLPIEVVHHRNGNKSDNGPENLELYQTNADHLRAELTGRTPNYSPDGLRRMRENAQRINRRRAKTRHSALKNGATRTSSDRRKGDAAEIGDALTEQGAPLRPFQVGWRQG